MNRLHPITFCVILILLTLSPNQTEAQYYIRAGATGNNDGTDWENAYTTIPYSKGANNDWYTNLVRGETYYISEGDYRGGTFYFADDENGELYITLKKATAEDHGTNAGWQDSYGNGQAIFEPIVIGTSYYIFDGAKGGGPGSWNSGHGIKIMYDDLEYNDRIRLIDLRGTNWWAPPLPHNIEFRHLEIQHRGMDTGQADDGLYNALQGVDDLYDEDLKNAGPQHIVISHCYFHDFGRNPLLVTRGRYWLVEKNYFARNSSSAAIHSEGWQDFYSNDMIIRNNIWNDLEGTAYIALKHNSAYSNSNWQIYGNVFYRTKDNPYEIGIVGGDGIIALSGGGISGTTISFQDIDKNTGKIIKSDGGFSSNKLIIGEKIMISGSKNNDGLYMLNSKSDTELTLSTSKALINEEEGPEVVIGTGYAYNISVFNNTFVNIEGYNLGFMTYGLGLENYAYNNIWFANNGNILRIQDPEAKVISDYNYFSRNWDSQGYYMDEEMATYEEHGKYDTIDPFIDWANGNFRLKVGITGKVLSDLGTGVSTDMYGTIRGADGSWDIGAIEYNPYQTKIRFVPDMQEKVDIYPNPVHSLSELKIKTPEVLKIRVYSLTGIKLGEYQYGGYPVSLTPGIYILELQNNNRDTWLKKKIIIY